MTSQQLAYFLEAAHRSSFSAAAEALHMAQPSLSEQVRRLESELGVELFVRSGRGLVLTEAGERLRPHAQEVMAAAERAREAVAEVRELRGGLATFGTYGSASYYLVADLIAEFHDLHPDIRVAVVGQNSTEVADAVREGRIEAALIVLPVDDHGLDVRPAMEDEVFYVSADPARLRRRMTVERLAGAPLILYDARWGWADPTRRQLAERAQRAGVALEAIIEVEEPATAFDLAARGLGDTIASATIAGGARFPRRLGRVSFADPLYDTHAFVTRRGAHLSPTAREFLAVAQRRLDRLGRR